MRKLIIGWLLVIGIVSVGRACEHCAALAVGNVVPAKVKYFGLKEVRLLDSPFKNAMDRMRHGCWKWIWTGCYRIS